MSLPREVRKAPLAPRRKVRAHVSRRERELERERERYWRLHAISGGCVMCRHAPVDAETRAVFHYAIRRMEAHHVLPKSKLRDLGLTDHADIYDERNSCGLCEYHHARHTNYSPDGRMPRELVPESVYDFAAEHSIDFLLDAEYPP